MPPQLLKPFKSRRMTLPSESDCAINYHASSPSATDRDRNRNRCRYIKPMLDFWQSLLAALERLAMLPSLIHSVLPSLPSRKRLRDVVRTYDRTMDDLLLETQRLLEAPLDPAKLLHMSGKLQDQFAPKLQASDICMLPSYNHKLPSGLEKGTYLALDVGGSTFRVAVVDLTGQQPGAKSMRIVNMKSYKIDNSVRHLRGNAFFDWMAEKIETAISDPQVKKLHDGSQKFAMGLAWSFPVEQTSIRSGNLLTMGKGFLATEGTLGQDLSELIMAPCRKRNLPVSLDSIVNDSSATLLSRAYEDPATRFAVILGTGFNIAVHLPTSALASSKYKGYPQKWLDEAKHVLVNTELSMFGKDIFPLTKWDEQLNEAHDRPDFQPFEHMISGRYLGEIVRLIIVDAVRSAGLFSGELPDKLNEPYALDTGTLAAMELDESKSLTNAIALFQSKHSLSKPPSYNDIHFVRQVSQLVSHRAAAFLAAGIHALWELRIKAEGLTPAAAGKLAIGCNGSVIEKYPLFRGLCQSHLDELTTASGAEPNSISLEIAVESAIFGAAVAVCCLEE
ncbi:hexokinase-1 [Periconia macrospinosa]|uniref:Phosphotransferase n=1 Tax=Periconia macrospinosa TaxID=97972 RepID=A0A2V1DTJ9_9PLEO|nr:hexokinase-1 [Periconia macrospinosa]